MAAPAAGFAGGDGLLYGNRVGHFNYEKELATVIDAILNSTTIASRLLYNAKNFNRATLLKTVKILRRTQGQWISGLEPLNSSAENVTIQMQFNRTLYSQPKVNILAEALARQYDSAIDYDQFEMEDVVDEVVQDLSAAIVSGTGTGNQPDSLDMICDDGTNYTSIGGQSRSTYTSLAGTNTSFSAVGSLSKLATMFDAISDTGPNETPTILATTFSVFSLIESLYTPMVRHEYGFLPVGSKNPSAHKADGMGNGFSFLDWRGIPIIRDKAIASGVGYMLNENYLDWYGDDTAPDMYKPYLKKVSLGSSNVKEGQSADMRPSDFHGFFYQKDQIMPNQAGMIGRVYLSGQLVSFQPRRQARFSGFTGV
jgi:hypothetical protein